MAADKQRRALTSQGGPRRSQGEPGLRAVLERALDAAAHESPDLLTHNFHAWPARMHPWLARVLVVELAGEGARMLDPFSGSGTTLVEAQRRGVPAVGVDLNPLARRVAEVKCRITTAADRDAFVVTLEGVVERSHARAKERRASRAPLTPAEAQRYEGHVLRELGGLWHEIQDLPTGIDKRCLEVLLSAIVVKFSKQRADTAKDEVQKRIGRHVPTRFFERRGRELVERWAAYAEELPERAPRARILEGDARDLARLVKDQRFTLVVSSPPYGGTYDYVEHHSLRYPWLGLDPRSFERKEIGARRRLSQGDDAEQRWQTEVRSFLSSMAAVMAPDAVAVLVLGDADVGGKRVDAERQVERLAGACGLRLTASASEERLDWRGKRSRREHLLALVRLDEKVGDKVDEKKVGAKKAVAKKVVEKKVGAKKAVAKKVIAKKVIEKKFIPKQFVEKDISSAGGRAAPRKGANSKRPPR